MCVFVYVFIYIVTLLASTTSRVKFEGFILRGEEQAHIRLL